MSGINELESVNSFCEKNPAFTNGGLRWQIFNEETNGLKSIKAIVRIGRNVYINPERYFLWVELQNTGELDTVVTLILEMKASGKYLPPEDAVVQIRGGEAA